jgi:hypothetical protein
MVRNGGGGREPLRRLAADPATITHRRRETMGRPVVIGLGTLILLLIAVAYFF